MTTPDTLDLNTQPFYQWDGTPYVVETDVSDMGVAVGDTTFSPFFVPDSCVVHDTVVRPSLFKEHALAAQHDGLVTRSEMSTPVWVFGLLLALVALLTFYYRTCKLRLKDIGTVLVDSRAMDRTLRNNNLNNRFRFLPMGLLMLACVMLPVHQMALAKTGFGGYVLLVAAVATLYLLRNGLLRLLAIIFDNGTAVDSYITSNYFYHLALATLTLPLLLPLAYMPFGKNVLLYLLAGVLAVELAMRLFRGLKLFLTQSSGPYIYLFYYLCIVEVTPILVLIKWIIE